MRQLIPHPSSKECAAGIRLAADVRSREGAVLELTYAVDSPMNRLRIQGPTPPQCTPDLWKHTCFELFVCAADALAYHEYNFSPSGSWALYAFDDYRSGGPLEPPTRAPQITQHRNDNQLIIDVTVDLCRLANAYAHSPIAVGLTAVIEHRDGALSYWALTHGDGEPDFHRRDNFILRV